MLPRRFLTLTALAAFGIFCTFLLFLNRGDVVLTTPMNIPAGWTEKFEEQWEETFRKGKHEEQWNDAVKPVLHGDTEEELDASTAEDTPGNAIPGELVAATTTTSSGVQQPSPFPPQEAPLPARLNVAVIESGGTNDETTAALIHSFGDQSLSHLSLYTLKQRYGIGEIIKGFDLAHRLAANKTAAEFAESVAADVPDILVSATCESDLIVLDKPLTALLKQKKTYLFCIVHQPERWAGSDLTKRIRPWIDQQFVDFITFSPHTAHYLRTEVINDWEFNATVMVRHLTPLFPVVLPDNDFPVARASSKDTFQYPIAIYGDYDASRHNYTDAFESLVEVKERTKTVKGRDKDETKSQTYDISLHIFGERVPPDVPKKVKPFLSVDRELTYQRQYELLSKSYILLPAFSSNDYLTRLASWSVPAALMAGVPIVATDEILQAYGYLPKDAVWVRYGGETEMKIAERVAMLNVEEHRKKKDMVQTTCRDMIKRNGELVDEWVQIAVRKLQRAAWRDNTVDVQGKMHGFFKPAPLGDSD
jgi:hypothetical protein